MDCSREALIQRLTVELQQFDPLQRPVELFEDPLPSTRLPLSQA